MEDSKIHRMLSPDGKTEVHVQENDLMHLARLGYLVPLTSPEPDVQHGYIPLQNVQAAVNAGFTFGHKGQWKR